MKSIKNRYYISYLIIFICVFLSFFYIDLTSLTIWSTNIWDCIFDVGIKNYYQYAALNLQGIEHAIVGNDLLIYLPWTVWNFPIWLLGKIAQINISTNIWMLTYSKMFLLFVLIGIGWITKKICQTLEMDETERKQVLLLSGSSLFVLTSVAYAGQNDVLPIFFFMLAILYLLKKKSVSFYICIAISLAMKPYMLFSFIVIVCLLEKNIGKIFLKIMAGVSLFILQKLILLNFPYYQESMNSGAADGEITLLLKAKIMLAGYEVSVLVLLLGIVAIWAYCTKIKEEQGKYIIYYATAPILIMFAVSGYSFYRPIYLVPLLYILMIQNKKIPIYVQLFIEMVLIGAMYYQFLRIESLFYNPYYINTSWIGYLFHTQIPKGVSFSESITRLFPNLNYFFSISQAVILLAMGLLVIGNHPKCNQKLALETWENAHWAMPLRVICNILVILVSMIGYFIFRNTL